MPEVYKGILDKNGQPVRLKDIASLYRTLVQHTGQTSMEDVANVLNTIGYRSRSGGLVNRHQVFRAISRLPNAAEIIGGARKKVGKWMVK